MDEKKLNETLRKIRKFITDDKLTLSEGILLLETLKHESIHKLLKNKAEVNNENMLKI